MHRALRFFALTTFVALVAAACVDSSPSAPRAVRAIDATTGALVCASDINDLLAQAEAIFGAGSPNFNSVRGKLENLQHHLDNNNPAEAKNRAHDIVAFVLQQEAEHDLVGTNEEIATFLNGVYCLAGLDITITDPANSELIFPTDSAQIVYGLNNTAGVSFAAFPVIDPTLVTIAVFNGRLNTKLDQYPGFIQITIQSESNAPLTSPATVAVCATDVPETVGLDDLRLGHGVNDTGFVITPRPDSASPVTPQLACEAEPALRVGQRILNAVRSAFSVREAHATSAALLRGGVSGTVTEFSPFAPVDTELRSGGVSGTVTEFSPFAPVDTELRSGGVSGTVTEFMRAPMPMVNFSLDGAASVESLGGCDVVSVGAPMAASCLPMVSVTTRQGTVLADVPVDWAIPSASGGSIAPRTGETANVVCGDFARTAATTTSSNGNAGVCWTLGGEGAYQVTARARVGGDAPEGVTFSNDDGADSVTFNVTVAPVTIQIVSGNNQTGAPGTMLPLPPTVRVLNHLGQPAAGVLVDWTALANSDASVSPSPTPTDASGLASAWWVIGAGYNELRAAIRNAADTAVTFVANGSSGALVMNSCPVGGSGDPINDPSKPFAFWMPNPGLGNTIQEIDLFFSATGKANRPADYRIALVTRLGGFNQVTWDSTVVNVELRGSASEAKRATFRLQTPVAGVNGRNAPAVTMHLVVLNNPDQATVRFNSGTCSPGQNCKVPRGCSVTEVSAPTPFPLGTFYRKSVGMTVRGVN